MSDMSKIKINYRIPKIGGGIYASNRRVQPREPYRTKPMSEGKYE